ncbi:hypothetical protein [Pectobacterium polaris]|uniref:hypothetical protein n=1 Tax=Pectobacterium polaris TaxID=2042057 RepID=UPI0020C728AE|nr:hypothetical protein [Pectobacterium polaris]
MADTDSNTGASYQSLPDYENRYSAMSAALAHLDFSNMAMMNFRWSLSIAPKHRPGFAIA